MPFKKKQNGPQPGERANFIGRVKELNFFTLRILLPEEPAHNVVSIYGPGGVGKTTLLNHFLQSTHTPPFNDYCLVAMVNEQQTTPASMMERFAEQLRAADIPLEDFERELGNYQESAQRLRAETESQRDASLVEGVDLLGAAAEDILPVGGKLLRKGAKVGTEALLKERRMRQHLKDAARLENPINNLTKAFVQNLNQITQTQITLSFNRQKRSRRVVLFFDAFEQVALEAGPWLLEHFLPIPEISKDVVLVIAGRDPIERSAPRNPKRWLPYLQDKTICSVDLNPFTEDETYQYLTECEITDPTYMTILWQLSKGLPFYLSLLTVHRHQDFDPTRDVVDNFLRGIPESDQLKQRLALDAALFSRPFNRDDLAVLTYIPEEKLGEFYQWLINLSFVQSNLHHGRHYYHELAQELFSRHLYHNSENDYYKTRIALVAYYKKQLEAIQAALGIGISRSADWLEWVLALAYQLFCLPDSASHEQAMKYVLDAYETTAKSGRNHQVTSWAVSRECK